MSGSESPETGPDIAVRCATALVGSQAQSVIQAVEALCGRVPLDGADRTELDSAMLELRTVRSFYDTMDILIARRSRQLAEAGKAGPAADSLAAGGRRSKRDAKAAADREQTCDRLPIVEDALTSGAMSAGHVDAIANATAFMNDEEKARFDQHAAELTRRAAIDTVERFARYCYQLARQVTRDEGQSRLNDQKTRNSLRYWIDNQVEPNRVSTASKSRLTTPQIAEPGQTRHETQPTTTLKSKQPHSRGERARRQQPRRSPLLTGRLPTSGVLVA